jgi:flagellar motility protein MotE (MotC chaperone)
MAGMTIPFPQIGARTVLAITAAGLLAMLASSRPAATEAIPEGAGQTATEIERFCGGIADAARDRRYTLQAMELKKLQADIDERIKKLDEKRVEYEDWMKRRETFLAQAEDSVVKIYATMKPDAAAERLAALDVQLAAGIMMKLDTRKAGVILNEMDSKAAAAMTTIMAAAARREDPS